MQPANPVLTQLALDEALVPPAQPRLATAEVDEPRVTCDLCKQWCYPITLRVVHPRWRDQPKTIHTHTCNNCLKAYAEVLGNVALPQGETRW